MQKQPKSKSTAYYQIVLQGRIPAFREQWFEGMTIRYDENGDSILSGEVIDQSALHGILDKIRDMGVILISITKIESVAR
jgi:hypothetical protein